MTVSSMSLNSQRELCHVCCGTNTGKPVTDPCMYNYQSNTLKYMDDGGSSTQSSFLRGIFNAFQPTQTEIVPKYDFRRICLQEDYYKSYLLNSTCSNQDYNAVFSNFVKTNKQTNLPPKGVASF